MDLSFETDLRSVFTCHLFLPYFFFLFHDLANFQTLIKSSKRVKMKKPVSSHQISTKSGAIVTVSDFGAHVLSWIPANRTENLLYLSKKSDLSGKTAIRGGIPIIFPQFSNRGPLPKHGFARLAEWELTEITEGETESSLTFRLEDSPESRYIWPYRFKATYRVKLTTNQLQTSLSISNNGVQSYSFTTALHSYFSVQDIQTTTLNGLDRLTYTDSLKNNEKVTSKVDKLSFSEETDRIYLDAIHPLFINQSGKPILKIESAGFKDAVVWNPWEETGAKLADLDKNGYQHFLCVEPATIEHPILLNPGQTWTGSQLLTSL